MKSQIVFNKIVVIRPFYFALIGFFIVAPIAIIVGTILRRTLFFAGAMILGVCVGWGAAMLIFRALRKTIQITFDGDYINLKINQETTRYLKTDLRGFYSFDYRTASNYTISICLYFNNGKRLNISDYNIRPACKDEERRNQLIQFTKIMEEELGFSPLKENKTRKRLRIGYTWFSRAY